MSPWPRNRDQGAETNLSLPPMPAYKKKTNKDDNCKPISFTLISCYQGTLPDPLILGTAILALRRLSYTYQGVGDAEEKGTGSLLGPLTQGIGEGACGEAGLGLLKHTHILLLAPAPPPAPSHPSHDSKAEIEPPFL